MDELGRWNYYVPITEGVSVLNPEIIPILFQVRWYGGDGGSNSFHVCVKHENGGEVRTSFSVVDYVVFDINEKSPYRRAVISLESTDITHRVFALLELDLKNPFNCVITFSPVPFGENGKPQLPLKEEPLLLPAFARLLTESKRTKGQVWFGGFSHDIEMLHKVRQADVELLCNALVDMQLAAWVGGFQSSIAPTPMFDTAEKFFDVFGVPLPDVTAPAKPADWLPAKLRHEVIAPFLREANSVLFDALGENKSLALWAAQAASVIDHLQPQQVQTVLFEIHQWLVCRWSSQILPAVAAKDRECLEKLQPLFDKLKAVLSMVNKAVRATGF